MHVTRRENFLSTKKNIFNFQNIAVNRTNTPTMHYYLLHPLTTTHQQQKKYSNQNSKFFNFSRLTEETHPLSPIASSLKLKKIFLLKFRLSVFY